MKTFENFVEGIVAFRRSSQPGDIIENVSNITDDLTSKLKPVEDVSARGVFIVLCVNCAVAAVLLCLYEVLRRVLPAVYSGRKLRAEQRGYSLVPTEPGTSELGSHPSVPDLSDRMDSLPFDWVFPVHSVPWSTVLQVGGLDAYMFLRYIRMCLRITGVAAFWGMVVLWPLYASAHGTEQSWYHLSMANINKGTKLIWVPTVFIYIFTGFVFFVVRQEYIHYLDLRMDFLGRGDSRIDPQHHYSLMVERIPEQLRSDKALFDFFDKLFPGKVHSAGVVLNVPKLDVLSEEKARIVRRLEKAIAHYIATLERPMHIVGRPRILFCGVEEEESDICAYCSKYHDMNDPEPPKIGDRVDTISYYTRKLAEKNKEVFIRQRRKTQVARTGEASIRASWFNAVVNPISNMATQVIDESIKEHDLTKSVILHESLGSPTKTPDNSGEEDQHDGLGAGYGSLNAIDEGGDSSKVSDLLVSSDEKVKADLTLEDQKNDHPISDERTHEYGAPSESSNRSFFVRIAARLGFDFVFGMFQYLKYRMRVYVDNITGATMSETGFVTFLDHTSVSCAASTTLTHKPNVLDVKMSPEPRDIKWKNVALHADIAQWRERFVNSLLVMGAVLWSIPLALIQSLASAEQVAKIPGFGFFISAELGALVEAYLPVVALLTLILILPVIFEYIAVHYERRKSLSNIQESIVERFFYYQLANIYVTVTAGSLWKSLSDILDDPSRVLKILGQYLPLVVGYFISLLITKILAGLPVVILRLGALSRMLFLRGRFSTKKLSQRELDSIYRDENLQYGREYPSQLLVLVICFTYAVISPIILPVGALYFFAALIVYKKQVLYVYNPVYESGGALFPLACNWTINGLICAQLTFLGYSIFRQDYRQAGVQSPLLFLSFWMKQFFKRNYVDPSKRLSLERAMELDVAADRRYCRERNEVLTSGASIDLLRRTFRADAYRQPVLSEQEALPNYYRRGETDRPTEEALESLQTASDRQHRIAEADVGAATLPNDDGNDDDDDPDRAIRSNLTNRFA